MEALTDEQMARVARILIRQLRLATPETYAHQRGMVMDLHHDFRVWFQEVDPDFLPERFFNLIFEEYPEDLYG